MSLGLGLSTVTNTKEDEEQALKKIKDLKFLLEQEKRAISNYETMIKRKQANVTKILNREGDLEVLKESLENEKNILKKLEEKNQGVLKKIGVYAEMQDKGLGELEDQEKLAREKLRELKAEGGKFEGEIYGVKRQIADIGDVRGFLLNFLE
jgi:septal ring factor EnvC (AmiA/AmiB activator)